eukprot:10070124-Ditylum_brightwellii.AAC.1
MLSHHDKEIICCVMQQDAKHLPPRVPTRGWKFFANKNLPYPTSFYLAGFFIISPKHVYLQGWDRRAKLPVGPQATVPHLTTTNQVEQ